MNPTIALSSAPSAHRGTAMQTTTNARTHRGIAMHTALSTISVIAEVTSDRPSGIHLRKTRRPEKTRTELRASQVENIARAEIAWFFQADGADRASEGARLLISGWLAALTPEEQRTLALRHDATPPPPTLEDHWDEGFALGLCLVAGPSWRPAGRVRHSLERDVSDQLEAAVEKHGGRVLRHIERRATWAFAEALRAYAHARGRAPSVLPEAR